MGMIKVPISSIEYFKSNLDDIFESGNLAESKWNNKLTEFAKEYCKVENATATSSNGSGLVALMLICKNYFNRKNVLIQSNTMYGVKTMVYSAGCELDGYIDCQLNTLMPNINDVIKSVEKYKGSKENLIILLSHIGGIINPDIELIADFCKSENIILLEDCAHSFGATLKNKHSGTFGDAGVYSFYATKSIPAGEGGLVITKNNELGELVKRFVIYDRFEQKMLIGNNNRPSEIQALFIYSVLKNTNEILKNKTDIGNKYISVCNELNINYINQITNFYKGNYYKFIIYNEKQIMSEFLPNLKTKTSAVYDYALGDSILITDHHYCLPIWYGQEEEFTNKAIDELCKSIKK